VYSHGRIRIDGAGSTYFYGDAMTSDYFIDTGNHAQFPTGGQVMAHIKSLWLPDSSFISELSDLAMQDGWIRNEDTDLFLGNYDYIEQAPGTYVYWGFNFYDDDLTDGKPVAEYRSPPVNFGSQLYGSESFYPAARPMNSLGTIDLLNASGIPNDNSFNGVILINGDLHIWGKLRGRSLTILCTGDIYIEREVLMGTEIRTDLSGVPLTSPLRDDGQPVNLALISARSNSSNPRDISGNIFLSSTCPRVMRIDSVLLAPGGELVPADYDSAGTTDASQLDLDHSHKHHARRFNITNNRAEWISEVDPTGEVDINFDGRLDTDMNGWNERDINDTENHYLWYLTMTAPVLTGSAGNLGFWQIRSGANPVVTGRTRDFLYNPSIKYNPPPFLPIPENALHVLEWSSAFAY
jgi:hypothetical protein